jgi:hypothetical protein
MFQRSSFKRRSKLIQNLKVQIYCYRAVSFLLFFFVKKLSTVREKIFFKENTNGIDTKVQSF